MSQTIRLATFNCENLFSRPRIFSQPPKRASELLGYVAELQEALQNQIFDHARIQSLKNKLKGFATINDLRGKHGTAIGVGEWLGTVELTRSDINDVAVTNTSQVIADVNADVICLMEVENRILLQLFHDNLLYKKFFQPKSIPGYEYILLIDGNDDRGIDVAVMSRLPILGIRSHLHERTLYDGNEVKTFSRDCLEVDVKISGSRTIHVLVNHLKSMGYSPKTDPQSNRRRLGQATRLAELSDQFNLDKDYVVIAGDLNSDPSSSSVQPIVQHSRLYNVNLELPANDRGTYKTGKKQLDYIFVSNALRKKLAGVYLERRGVYTKAKWPVYQEVTSDRTQASDHAAVVADFKF